MAIRLLTLRQVFDRIFLGKNNIDHAALLDMIQIEDSFNGDTYENDVTINDATNAWKTYGDGTNDSEKKFVLYAKSTGTDGQVVWIPVNNPDNFIPSSVELYLKRIGDNEYVQLYTLRKVNPQKFIDQGEYLFHYRDTASRVAGILYALCCYQKKLMQLYINDIEAVNREQRELNRIASLISVIQNDLSEKDTGIDDVAMRHLSTIYADIIAFFVQHGFLDTMATGSKINKTLVNLLKQVLLGDVVNYTTIPAETEAIPNLDTLTISDFFDAVTCEKTVTPPQEYDESNEPIPYEPPIKTTIDRFTRAIKCIETFETMIPPSPDLDLDWYLPRHLPLLLDLVKVFCANTTTGCYKLSLNVGGIDTGASISYDTTPYAKNLDAFFKAIRANKNSKITIDRVEAVGGWWMEDQLPSLSTTYVAYQEILDRQTILKKFYETNSPSTEDMEGLLAQYLVTHDDTHKLFTDHKSDEFSGISKASDLLNDSDKKTKAANIALRYIVNQYFPELRRVKSGGSVSVDPDLSAVRDLNLVASFRAWTQFQALLKHHRLVFAKTDTEMKALLPPTLNGKPDIIHNIYDSAYWVKASDAESDDFKGYIGLGDHWVFDPRVRNSNGQIVDANGAPLEDNEIVKCAYFQGFSSVNTGRSCEHLGQIYTHDNVSASSTAPADDRTSPDYSMSWFGRNPPSDQQEFENGIAALLTQPYGITHFIPAGIVQEDTTGRKVFTPQFKAILNSPSNQTMTITYNTLTLPRNGAIAEKTWIKNFYINQFGNLNSAVRDSLSEDDSESGFLNFDDTGDDFKLQSENDYGDGTFFSEDDYSDSESEFDFVGAADNTPNITPQTKKVTFNINKYMEHTNSPGTDYWAIPDSLTNNVVTYKGAYADDLKGAIETLADGVKLSAEHCGMWSDTIRIYTDQISNDSTGRTTAMQMALQMSQQNLSTATNMAKAVNRLYSETAGNIRL
jgi:hypothetical protein